MFARNKRPRFQRRQFGSKSGGRESGRSNFRFQPKNFRFYGKIFDFPGKNSIFLIVKSKIVFSPKVFTFSPFTPTFLVNFSLFRIKKTKKTLYNVLSVQNRL